MGPAPGSGSSCVQAKFVSGGTVGAAAGDVVYIVGTSAAHVPGSCVAGAQVHKGGASRIILVERGGRAWTLVSVKVAPKRGRLGSFLIEMLE